MKEGLLISYSNHYEFLIGEKIVSSTKNNRWKRKLSKENCDQLFGERTDEFVHHIEVYIQSEEGGLILLKSKHEDFFRDYKSLRCNHVEFNIIKEYLHKSGWTWFNGWNGSTYKRKSLFDYNPEDLYMICVREDCDKSIIPYFNDEIEYIEYQKDVKEIIRDLKLKSLGI